MFSSETEFFFSMSANEGHLPSGDQIVVIELDIVTNDPEGSCFGTD